jgi:hypothetical protein
MTRGTTNGVTWDVARHRLDSRLEIQFTSQDDGVFEGHIATRLELAPAAIAALKAAIRADREARTVGWAVRIVAFLESGEKRRGWIVERSHGGADVVTREARTVFATREAAGEFCDGARFSFVRAHEYAHDSVRTHDLHLVRLLRKRR